MKPRNHIDLLLGRFKLLSANFPFADLFIDLWKGLRFNPSSTITEKSAGALYFSVALQNILKEFNIQVIFDVGANIGQFRKTVREIGFVGKVISFEPVKEMYDQSLIVKDDLWMRNNFALGDSRQYKKIGIYSDNTFSSFQQWHSGNEAGIALSLEREEDVSIEMLDEFVAAERLEEKLPVSILKIDTQGYDLNVIKGALQSLKLIPVVLFEGVNKSAYEGVPRFKEVFDHLADLGFYIRAVSPVAFKQGQLVEFDVLMTRLT